MQAQRLSCLLVLAVAFVSCGKPQVALVVQQSRHCALCANATRMMTDTFTTAKSRPALESLLRRKDIRNYASKSERQSASFLAKQLLDSLAIGHNHFLAVTYRDTCDSCLNTLVPVRMISASVCSICHTSYSRSTTTERMKRKDAPRDTLAEKLGFCGARACKLKIKHPDWSLNDCQIVAKGRVRLGFSSDQVVASMGRPRDINRTVTAGSVSEQWVYGRFGPYLYFDDDVLTSWQD